MHYSIVSDSRGKTITLFFSDGETVPVSSEHPNFDNIYDEALAETLSEDEMRALTNIVATVGGKLTALSERVSVTGSTLLFDGDPIRSEISDHIIRLVRDSDERGWKALVNFLEKVQTNPNEHSRNSLYSWISGRNITITQNGDLLAYKGVRVDEDGQSRSVRSGTATVNGVVHEGHIPNPLGAVVEMPRSQVQHDTAVGCSTGLHAGTWEYASDFSRERVLTVLINPRDVVSVPTDSEAQKMRVSRYEVLSEATVEVSTPTYYEADEDDDYDPYEDEYGYEYDSYDDDFYPEDYEDEDEDEDDSNYDSDPDYYGDAYNLPEDDSDPEEPRSFVHAWWMNH